MNLKAFISTNTPERLEQVAERAGTKVIYLRQCAGGHRNPSPKLARGLEAASDREMTRYELRPDVFGPISTSNSPAIRDCP